MPDRSVAPLRKDFATFEIFLPPCEKIELKNGAPIYFVNGGAEDVVKIEWVFNAGNSFENKTGVAAAASRLIKNGTSRKSAFEISNHFDFFGAFLQTGCYNEYAVITLQTLAKRLRDTLPIVREILSDAQYPDREIQIFRQNAIQKMKVNLEKCEFVAGREIAGLLYGRDHPYGRKSDLADIAAVQREDLIAFYEKYYLNGDCTIFASGKLPEDFLPMMEDHFGSLNIGNKHPRPEFEIQSGEPKMYDILNDKNGVQSAIRIARPFPNKKHPDYKAAMVLNVILGGYFGSRLMSNIREDKGYTYGIYSYLDNHLQAGAWTITTEAGKEVASATIEESFKEMQRLCDEPVSEEELKLVRNYLIGHQLAALDGPFHIMDRWKSLILGELDTDFFYGMIDAIRTITPEALQAVAKKYFDPKDYFVLSVV